MGFSGGSGSVWWHHKIKVSFPKKVKAKMVILQRKISIFHSILWYQDLGWKEQAIINITIIIHIIIYELIIVSFFSIIIKCDAVSGQMHIISQMTDFLQG